MDCLLTNADLFRYLEWWIYGIGAISAVIGLYAFVLVIVRCEIRRQMKGFVMSGTLAARNKRGQFVPRGN